MSGPVPVIASSSGRLADWINDLNAVTFKTLWNAAAATVVLICYLIVWMTAALTSVRHSGSSANLYGDFAANVLIFLGGIMGINGAVYFGKRHTNIDYAAARAGQAPPAQVTTSGDNTQVVVTPPAPAVVTPAVTPTPSTDTPDDDGPDPDPVPQPAPPRPPIVTDMKRAAIQHVYQPGD